MKVADVLPKEEIKFKRPPMYKVVILNDDFTPVEFVIEVLQKFFNMNEERAFVVMKEAEKTGRAICGVFSKDIAETKVNQVNAYAQQHEHPLHAAIDAD